MYGSNAAVALPKAGRSEKQASQNTENNTAPQNETAGHNLSLAEIKCLTPAEQRTEEIRHVADLVNSASASFRFYMERREFDIAQQNVSAVIAECDRRVEASGDMTRELRERYQLAKMQLTLLDFEARIATDIPALPGQMLLPVAGEAARLTGSFPDTDARSVRQQIASALYRSHFYHNPDTEHGNSLWQVVVLGEALKLREQDLPADAEEITFIKHRLEQAVTRSIAGNEQAYYSAPERYRGRDDAETVSRIRADLYADPNIDSVRFKAKIEDCIERAKILLSQGKTDEASKTIHRGLSMDTGVRRAAEPLRELLGEMRKRTRPADN